MAQRGFTLIELLVVVSILSATAMAAFSFATADQAQVRIDDTRNRLEILRRSILGLDGPAYDGEVRLSGYVVDNGVLPENLLALTEQPTGYAGRGSVTPMFSSNFSGSTCIQSSGDAVKGVMLIKGHTGNYLRGRTHNGQFRDGWGNQSLDNDGDNFGWSLATDTSNAITITSLGADNAEGGSTTAEADQSMGIVADDWRVSLEGWTVTVKNFTTSPITPTSFKAALLVFENTAGEGQWKRFTSSTATCTTALAQQGDSCTLTFGEKSTCNGTDDPDLIPIGRHLLVLLNDSAIYPSSAPITAQVAFYPGAARPAATLEIR